MIYFLVISEKLLNKQIKQIENNNILEEILCSNLSKKEFILDDKLIILRNNKIMLERSILR